MIREYLFNTGFSACIRNRELAEELTPSDDRGNDPWKAETLVIISALIPTNDMADDEDDMMKLCQNTGTPVPAGVLGKIYLVEEGRINDMLVN